MKPAKWLASLGALVPWAGYASADPPTASPAIQPGEYVYQEGGGGTLRIQAANGKLTFAIYTLGSNAHVCELTGKVAGLEGRTDTSDFFPTCVVRLTPLGSAVTIDAQTFDACHAYCGANGFFEGKYIRPLPECAVAAVSATRATFKRLYDAKKFKEARATLEPLLRCEDVVDHFSCAWIRNDMAVTRHALNDDVGCREVLEPLRYLADGDDPNDPKDAAWLTRGRTPRLFAGYEAYKEAVMRLARATRFNLQLCHKP